jgi:twinkle protein
VELNKRQSLDDIAERLRGSTSIPDIDYEKYFKAKDDDKGKVKRVVDFYDEIDAYLTKGDGIEGVQLPFVKTNGKFAFRDGEVTLWTGQNGHRKSMVLGYIVLKSFLNQRIKACIASFEMKPLQTIKRMTIQHSHVSNPDYNEFADFMHHAGNDLYILDQMGGMTPERLYGIIYYCAEELGVKHFVIDSLMRVVPKEDDYNAQKDFIVKICEIANKTDIHIHVVHHTKKSDESKVGTRYDAKGSGAISDNVHNSIIVWSNKLGIKDMPPMILNVDKQRAGEWEGKVPLNFDVKTISFSDSYGEHEA